MKQEYCNNRAGFISAGLETLGAGIVAVIAVVVAVVATVFTGSSTFSSASSYVAGELIIAEVPHTTLNLGNHPRFTSLSQSFKALEPSIAGVSLGLVKKREPTQTITVSIRKELGGSAISSVSITPLVSSEDRKNPDWIDIVFPGDGVAVTPGEVYYLNASVDESEIDNRNYYQLVLDRKDPYEDGVLFRDDTSYKKRDGLVKIIFASAEIPSEAVLVAPMITPDGGEFLGPVTVSIESTDEGVQIYYVTDGSIVSPGSATLYTGPFELSANAIVNAQAFSGSESSNMVSSIFTVVEEESAEVTTGTIVLAVSKDAPLKKPHRDNNSGLKEYLLVKKGGGIVRFVLGFDLPNISSDQIKTAMIKMHVYQSANLGRGVFFGVFKLLEDWVEGNSRFDKFEDQPAVIGNGAGVTWNCGIDLDISDGDMDCDNPWYGGNYIPTPTDVFLHDSNTAIATYNVTADVLDALNGGDSDISWLVTKNDEKDKGSVRYYSKEGAAYFNDLTLVPQLILELK